MVDAPKKKIFISWSKDQSKRVARVLKEYLEELLDNIEVFVSDKDIDPGERNMNAVEAQLNNTTYGLLVVTQQNQGEAWLNFEAGALSKAVASDSEGQPRVVPLLVDIESANQLVGPISQFQAKKLDHDGLETVIASIARLIGDDPAVAKRRFNRAWDEYDEKLAEARSTPVSLTKPPRTQESKVDEILEIARSLQRALPSTAGGPGSQRVPGAPPMDVPESVRQASVDLITRYAKQDSIKALSLEFDDSGRIAQILVEPSEDTDIERFVSDTARMLGYQIQVGFLSKGDQRLLHPQQEKIPANVRDQDGGS